LIEKIVPCHQNHSATLPDHQLVDKFPEVGVCMNVRNDYEVHVAGQSHCAHHAAA
jgi:hypothetical protein